MRVKWSKYDKIAAALSLAVVVFYGAAEIMPTIDGTFNPVVVEGKLTSHTPSPPPEWRGVWAATAVKQRNCEYILRSLKWYFGGPDGAKQQVYAVFEDRPEIRPKGILEWENLVIDLDPEIVRTNSYATVRHRCPWAWWDVESRFYTSP